MRQVQADEIRKFVVEAAWQMGLKRFLRSFLPNGKAPLSPSGLRCALVEYNYYHGETMPTLVHILNKLGVTVDVFAPGRLRRNNPFVYANSLRYGLRDSGRLSAGRLAKGMRGFDFVMANSLEPKHILTTVGNLPLPLIGVMHNASLMIADRDYADFFSSPKRKPLVLARHISAFVSNRITAQWIAPLELGNVNRGRHGRDARVIFCVQGNVEFDRRNYGSLLAAVQNLTSKGFQKFRVRIIGRNDTPDGTTLKNDISARGLEHLFEFSRGEIPFGDYFESIAGADFLIPLVDRVSGNLAPYFEDKVSSSMSMSLAFQVIPIVHADFAALYGVENESFTYSGDLEQAMLRALKAGDEELRQMRLGLLHKKAELLDASADNLKSLLEELGLRTIH